jgi:hypothetical protein
MQFHWRWYKAKLIVGISSKGFLGKLCVDVWLRLSIYQARTFHWQTLNFATRLRNKKVLWIMQHYTKNEWMSILWVTGIASSYFWTFVFRNIIYHITLVGQLRPLPTHFSKGWSPLKHVCMLFLLVFVQIFRFGVCFEKEIRLILCMWYYIVVGTPLSALCAGETNGWGCFPGAITPVAFPIKYLKVYGIWVTIL